MSDVEAQITLRDTIEQAIETHEPDTLDASPGVEVSNEKPRDEVGRFAQKAEKTSVESSEQVEAAPVKPRPSSWKKDYDEQWGKLDPTVQDYISQREADYAKGVSTYKQNWDQAAPIYEAMQPFMPLLQQHNIAPQQWISNLGNAHKTLAMGSPEEKAHMFARLASDYGVDLGSLANGQSTNPQFSALTQELSQLKNQWSQFQTQREQHEQQQFVSLVEEFQSKNPLLEKVSDEVLGLLQSGLVKGATPQERLQNAYEKAIRFNDEAWQSQQAEAQQAKARETAEANHRMVAQKKALAVSPRSSSPTGMMNTGSGKKGLRETLSEQLESVAGGRV